MVLSGVGHRGAFKAGQDLPSVEVKEDAGSSSEGAPHPWHSRPWRGLGLLGRKSRTLSHCFRCCRQKADVPGVGIDTQKGNVGQQGNEESD